MNRTALAVIALAVGAIMIIVLFHIYRPKIDDLADQIFGNITDSVDDMNWNFNDILPMLRANVASLF